MRSAEEPAQVGKSGGQRVQHYNAPTPKVREEKRQGERTEKEKPEGRKNACQLRVLDAKGRHDGKEE